MNAALLVTLCSLPLGWLVGDPPICEMLRSIFAEVHLIVGADEGEGHWCLRPIWSNGDVLTDDVSRQPDLLLEGRSQSQISAPHISS